MRIRIESLPKRYEKIDIFDGVTFHNAEGKMVAILGPHGAVRELLKRALALRTTWSGSLYE